MKIEYKNKKSLLDKIKRTGAALLVGAMLIPVPNVVNAEEISTNISESTNQNVETGYVMEENSYIGIKLGEKTSNDSFVTKAKFLLGEQNYNDYYITNKNTSELKEKFENMYGKDTFVKLKEFEIRSMNYSDAKLRNEYINAGLFIEYEVRQMGLFPNSKFNKERQDRIDAYKIKQQAIKNIQANKLDAYDTLYEMNEFTSLCVGNALLNEKYVNPSQAFEIYTNQVLDPIVVRIDIYNDGNVREFDAIDFGKYSNYNKIKHNPITYNLIEEVKQYKKAR